MLCKNRRLGRRVPAAGNTCGTAAFPVRNANTSVTTTSLILAAIGGHVIIIVGVAGILRVFGGGCLFAGSRVFGGGRFFLIIRVAGIVRVNGIVLDDVVVRPPHIPEEENDIHIYKKYMQKVQKIYVKV